MLAASPVLGRDLDAPIVMPTLCVSLLISGVERLLLSDLHSSHVFSGWAVWLGRGPSCWPVRNLPIAVQRNRLLAMRCGSSTLMFYDLSQPLQSERTRFLPRKPHGLVAFRVQAD